MTRGLFVTGTDTGVGKTTVASALARHLCRQGLRTGAYKPVASGSVIDATGQEVWDDVERLHAALGDAYPRERVGPQCFRAPLAPPVAARLEGRAVDPQLVHDGARWWCDAVDWLLVEGAGGWLSPLTDTESNADFAAELGWPVLIVGRLGLGTINHTLLTVAAVQSRGLKVAGIVLNDVSPETSDQSKLTNPQEIQARCNAALLGVFPWQAATDLLQVPAFLNIDWLSLFAENSVAGNQHGV